MWVKISEERKKFSDLRSRYHRQANRRKLILSLKKYFKTWRILSLALPVHTFLSHLHFFKVSEIMLLKYRNLMLPAGHILDLYCAQLSNATPFCKNYKKLYFDTKHLEKKWNRDGAGVRGRFLVPFYPKYWFYRWNGSSVLCSSCKNTFVGAGNLKMVTSKFWFEYLWGPYILFLGPVLCIALVS